MTQQTRSRGWALCAALAATTWLSACAGTAEAPATTAAPKADGVAKFAGDPRLGEEISHICPARALSGFSQNTRDTVVIAMGKDSYMIEMSRSCYALSGAMGIAPLSNSTCLQPGDQLLVTDQTMPGGASGSLGTGRCTVRRIFNWTPLERLVKPPAKAS